MQIRLLSTFAALVAVLAFPIAPAYAVVVDGLYEATVPVADQSVGSQRQGLADALAIVLVRNSGSRDAATLDADPARLVQQFRFERRDEVDPATGEPVPRLYLWARFNPGAVQRVLVDHGVPIWGRERPAVVVWLAYDDGFERAVVDDTSPPEFRQALNDAAQRRGLPIIPPLMDLQDRAALPFTDLWGAFDDAVLDASRRYNGDAVLVGRIYALDRETWGARWILYTDGIGSHFETAPAALSEVVADGVHQVADRFALRFSLLPDTAPDGRTRVIVTGVDDVRHYASVLDYLGSLSPVANVEVERVEGDEVVFLLELRGTPEQVERAIELGTRLSREADDWEALTGALRYRLRQ